MLHKLRCFFSITWFQRFKKVKNVIVELKNQMFYNTTHRQVNKWSVDNVMNPFFFLQSIFLRKLRLISLFSVHYRVTLVKLLLNDFRLLVGLLRLVCLLSTSRMYNFWSDIIFSKSLYYFHIVHQPISSLNTFPFLFPLTFLLIISFSLSLLTLEISVILFPSFWLFVVPFWMLWMLVTVNKLTYMACRVTRNFLSNSFSESNEIGPILVTPSLGNEWWKNGKKKLLKVSPKTTARRKKRKRTRSWWGLKRLHAETPPWSQHTTIQSFRCEDLIILHFYLQMLNDTNVKTPWNSLRCKYQLKVTTKTWQHNMIGSQSWNK